MNGLSTSDGPLEAWDALPTAGPLLGRAELLQSKRKTEVWSLSGSEDERVIAKRCPSHEAKREHVVYRNILPGTGLSTPLYYGSVSAADGRTMWVFVKEVGGVPYSTEDPLHRELAAGYLAALHADTRGETLTVGLPDVGPPRYESMLVYLSETMPGFVSNPAFRCKDLLLLDKALEVCHTLLADWRRIDRVAACFPRSLVHGSFSGRNMRVLRNGAGKSLCVFDWGAAGRGIPSRDLANLVRRTGGSLDTYGRHFSDLDTADLHLLVALGRVFRAVEHITGIVSRLQVRWIEKPIGRLAEELSELATARELVCQEL